MKLLGKIILALLMIAGCNGLTSLLPETGNTTMEESGNALMIGDIGPSGGAVFHVGDGYVMEAISVQEWSPQIWTPKTDVLSPVYPFCTGLESSAWFDDGPQQIGESIEIGAGLQATEDVIKRIDWNLERYKLNDLPYKPCQLRTNIFSWVVQAEINGVSDWYIPTSNELREVTSFENIRDQLNVNIGLMCMSSCLGTFVTSTVNSSGNLIFWNQFDHSMGTYSGYPNAILIRKTYIQSTS